MQLYIKNKMISLRGSSYVTDEAGRQIFEVRGKLFSITNKKFLYDMKGNRLMTIRNKYWNFLRRSAYIYDASGKKLMRLKERFFKPYYDVLLTEDTYEFEYELMRGTHIKRNGENIGFLTVPNSVEILIRDCFVLDVYDEKDIPLLVAFTIAHDNIRDTRDSRD